MKRCTKCGTEKLESAFPVNGGRLRSQCKTCVAERSRLWRKDNPEYAKEYMQGYRNRNYPQMIARMKANRQQIAEWKRARGCSVCGETEPWVLDMHHLDPTEKEANSATSATLKTFLKEAHKCILLCSNCHRKVHAGVLILSEQAISKYLRSIK